MIVVLYAHPYPHYSRACATLLEAIQDLPSLQVRSLYDIYPDFDIDTEAERAAVAGAKLVVWGRSIGTPCRRSSSIGSKWSW
jgi:glutathione-regulated potassium-efflux system ancillary protein KefF